MDNLYHNKEAFLRKAPKNFKWFFIFLLLFIILLFIILMQFNTYDHFSTKGIVECDSKCVIITSVPKMENYLFIKSNYQLLDTSIIEQELIFDEENYQSYYQITLTIDNQYSNLEVLDLTFYYHKQSILKKIITMFF